MKIPRTGLTPGYTPPQSVVTAAAATVATASSSLSATTAGMTFVLDTLKEMVIYSIQDSFQREYGRDTKITLQEVSPSEEPLALWKFRFAQSVQQHANPGIDVEPLDSDEILRCELMLRSLPSLIVDVLLQPKVWVVVRNAARAAKLLTITPEDCFKILEIYSFYNAYDEKRFQQKEALQFQQDLLFCCSFVLRLPLSEYSKPRQRQLLHRIFAQQESEFVSALDSPDLFISEEQITVVNNPGTRMFLASLLQLLASKIRSCFAASSTISSDDGAVLLVSPQLSPSLEPEVLRRGTVDIHMCMRDEKMAIRVVSHPFFVPATSVVQFVDARKTSLYPKQFQVTSRFTLGEIMYVEQAFGAWYRRHRGDTTFVHGQYDSTPINQNMAPLPLPKPSEVIIFQMTPHISPASSP